jgi:subfamily B ATP-binding cassette protein MsbA
MILYAIGSAGVAALIRTTIDEVLPHGTNLAFVAWAVIGLTLLKGIGSYGSSYLITDVGQRVVMDLRNALYRHLLGQSAGFFAQNTTGQLSSRINNDVGQVQQAVSETFGDLARESLALIGFAALLFWYDAWLAVFCIVSAPLIVYPLVRLGQRVRRTTRRSQEALAQLSHISMEGLTGHRIVKAFGNESKEADRFSKAAYQLFRTNMKVTAALSSLPPLMELLGGVGMAIALWYGSHEIASGRLTTGELTTFIATLLMMYGPAKKLSRVNANLQQAIAASERIFEMLDTHTEVTERAGAQPLAPFTRTIEIHDVTFGYDEAQAKILRGVSFAVSAGQMVAIVGRSGAGKTTLVNLLPRFYDVTGGGIRIDGIDIRDVTLKSLRGQIGMVTQETVLFDDSVASNIAYGALHASRAEIEAAARAANAHDFVMALPQKYETLIGERGQRLSGGQRQRLAIARALLKNAPILVLDEATSALDAESELLVQEALTNLMLNRTSFVIAHRLSTIRRADAIVVLERGRIVEIGRHDELLARPNGTYASLYEMQLLEVRKTERRMVEQSVGKNL